MFNEGSLGGGGRIGSLRVCRVCKGDGGRRDEDGRLLCLVVRARLNKQKREFDR